MYYLPLMACSALLGCTFWAAAAPTDEDLRLRIAQWLHKDDLDDPDARLPFEQPDRTAKVLLQILRQPEGFEVYPLANAIGLVAGLQDHVPQDSIGLLRDALSPYLLSGEWRLRSAATSTLGSLGRAEDLPLVTLMLSDQIYQVRLAAVVAVGKIGGPQAILALEIWEQRQAELDEARLEGERWLDPAIRQALEMARRQEQAEVTTHPATRKAAD